MIIHAEICVHNLMIWTQFEKGKRLKTTYPKYFLYCDILIIIRTHIILIHSHKCCPPGLFFRKKCNENIAIAKWKLTMYFIFGEMVCVPTIYVESVPHVPKLQWYPYASYHHHCLSNSIILVSSKIRPKYGPCPREKPVFWVLWCLGGQVYFKK